MEEVLIILESSFLQFGGLPSLCWVIVQKWVCKWKRSLVAIHHRHTTRWKDQQA